VTNSRTAWAYGLATTDADGRVLDTWYPEPALGEAPASASPSHALTALTGTHGTAGDRGVRLEVVLTQIYLHA
jgi:2,3,4,5-tetrahydropyridine-2-carboxylate N-succinyltransferase